MIIERLLSSLDEFLLSFLSGIELYMFHDLAENLLFQFLNILGREIEGSDKLSFEVWVWYFIFIEVPVEFLFEDGVLVDGYIDVDGGEFLVICEAT